MAAATVFASAISNPGGTGSTLTVTLSTHAAGDVLVVYVAKTGNVAWTVPTGWSLLDQRSVGTSTTGIVGTWMYRRVLSGDSLPLANPVCTLGATVTRAAICWTVRGADIEGVFTLPEWGARGFATGTANPIRPPSVTALAPEMLVLHGYGSRSATNAPDPASYTQDQEIIISGNLVLNASRRTVADQNTVLANQDASPTSGVRWTAGILCIPSPDYPYYRSGSQALTASGVSATPALPTGTSASDNRGNKDLIVATIECAGTPTISANTPADWVEIGGEWSSTTSGGGTTVRKYRAFYDGTLDRQFNRSTTGEIFVYFSVYRNAHQSSPVGAFETQQNASATTSAFPALTRTATKTNIQITCVADATPTYTAPSGWVERNDSQGVTCADQAFNATGTVGSASFTLSAASPTLCGLLEIASVASQLATILTPTTASLSLSSFAPTVTATAHLALTPAIATLTTATFAPALTMTGELIDNFNDNSRDTAKWGLGSIAFENAFVGVAEANQQVEITPLSNQASPAIYGYRSAHNWNFTGKQARVRIAGDPGSTVEVWLVVVLDASNYLRTWVAGGNLQTRSRVNTNNTNQDHGAFNFATQSHWRIRHDVVEDDIVWEVSSDGGSWSELRRIARPFAITSVNFYLSGGTGSSVPSPPVVQFDDFTHDAPMIVEVVTPASASLTLATFAPTVTTNITITPASVSLSLTSFSAQLKEMVVSGSGSLALTTFAPIITVSNNVTVTPETAALTTERFAPSLREIATPATRSLALTAFTPALIESVTPAARSLSLTAFAPSIGVRLTPATATLITTRFAPSVREGVTPATANLTLTTFSVATRTILTPATATIALTAFVPTLHERTVPTTTALVLQTFAPSITISADIVVQPLVTTLTLSGHAPSLHLQLTPTTTALAIESFAPFVTSAVTITPATALLSLDTEAPLLRLSLSPTTADLVLATFTPLIDTGGDKTVVPATVALTLTIFAPILVVPQPTPPKRVFMVESSRRTVVARSELRTYKIENNEREVVI